jgi:hypothetical protein
LNTVSFRRERWVYGLHALVGFLLALPILGLIGDWLLSALEAFLFMVVAMLGFELIPLLPVLAVGWATLVGYWLLVIGYWLWMGNARRRRFLVAWYASAALTLILF